MSTVDGTPAGIPGNDVSHSVAGSAKLEGDLPNQYRKGVLELRAAAIQSQRFRFGRGDFGARSRDIELRHIAGAEAPLGEVNVPR